MNFDDYSNSVLLTYIDEWVKGERDRKIMKRRIIDKIKLEALAEEFELSTRQINHIVGKSEKMIMKKLKLAENKVNSFNSPIPG